MGFELGIDHYTSASSDKIDPYTISSASMSDTRFYPSAFWNIQNEQKGTTFGLNASFSKEFDYRSFGIGTSFTKSSLDNNQEFTAKLQAYFDQCNRNGSFPLTLLLDAHGKLIKQWEGVPKETVEKFVNEIDAIAHSVATTNN